ncbi:hypothetical protein [Flavobacterium sp.]|uniref:hypothetical protein n=1 Tax=Flavobacterium sp. TaxID=239 RepID=UPI0025E62013|nr:hypothetical protein [Flavobacterium sp.]
MSERKNIDRLFQEKFKDFEVKPPKETWANIATKLDEKKKRRIIPFWWKLSGVAALFLIGFLISKSIYNPEVKTENSVVNETNSGKTNQINKSDINKKDLNVTNSTSDAVVTNSDKVKKEEYKAKVATYSSESSVAKRNSSNHRSLKNKSNSEKNKTAVAQSVFEKSQKQLAQTKNGNNQSKASGGLSHSEQAKQIAQTDLKAGNNKKNQSAFDNSSEAEQSGAKTPINLNDLKGNGISKTVTKEIENKVNDTASKKSVANNELEELLNEKESKLKQESKRNRWQLTSNVAPVFLGSISNGSPIDSTLAKNSKSYNTNVGFGLGLSYEVNKKLTVRAGLNKVNISYDTNNIVFFTGIQAKVLANVSPTASSAMIQIQNNAANNSNSISENGLLPFENSFANKNTGQLNQEIGYLEMPFEMTYALFDKKFGLRIIGGFSTLFLQDNSITIVSEGRETLLGKANNLNNVHFSTNFGMGIKYGFMRSFEFNLEPTIKYQLNTFSSNAGNFKPFIFGVYSGISYRF